LLLLYYYGDNREIETKAGETQPVAPRSGPLALAPRIEQTQQLMRAGVQLNLDADQSHTVKRGELNLGPD